MPIIAVKNDNKIIFRIYRIFDLLVCRKSDLVLLRLSLLVYLAEPFVIMLDIRPPPKTLCAFSIPYFFSNFKRENIHIKKPLKRTAFISD